jgi:hypothetical protein
VLAYDGKNAGAEISYSPVICGSGIEARFVKTGNRIPFTRSIVGIKCKSRQVSCMTINISFQDKPFGK